MQDLSITVMSDLPAEEVDLIEDPDEIHKIYKQSFIDEQVQCTNGSRKALPANRRNTQRTTPPIPLTISPALDPLVHWTC